MIHYHGTPFGGKRTEAAEFIRGRHVLIPFPRAEDLPVAIECAASFVVDNGAFTAWKQGEAVTDWQPYYSWCKSICRAPGFDWALIPDVIDGDEADNDALIQEWYKRMYHPIRVEGVPVWHLHESLDRLDRLCRHWQRVALGSSGKWSTPGTEGWHARMAEAMAVACDEHGQPRAKLHGLRMLRSDVVARYPLASADSTNVVQNANLLPRFGMYAPPTRSQRAAVIAARIESNQSPPTWVASQKQMELFA